MQAITREILDRAVELGVSLLQIETELTFIETKHPKLAGEMTSIQKSRVQ